MNVLPLIASKVTIILHSRTIYFKQVFNFAIIDFQDHVEQLKKLFDCDCPIVFLGETKIMLTPDFIFNPQKKLIEPLKTK
jgi:hypothetical protein